MLFKSKELKEERGYVEKDSYVRTDGSEVLAKRDWTQRKRELWERAEGRCEYEELPTPQNGIYWRCAAEGTIPAHIVPRHPLRDDRLSNLKLYCKFHDTKEEKQSWRKTRFGEGSKPICKRRKQSA